MPATRLPLNTPHNGRQVSVPPTVLAPSRRQRAVRTDFKQPAEFYTNLIVQPSFEAASIVFGANGLSVAGTGAFANHVTDWSWRGGKSARVGCSSIGAGSLFCWHNDVPCEEGKVLGYRQVIRAVTNQGLFPVVQWFNSAGTVISTAAMTNAPRELTNSTTGFTGTGEWEFRAIATAPAGATKCRVGLYAVAAGAFNVYLDSQLASHDLIDRNATRPGEGWDVPPYGDGDMEDWQWLGTPHASQSRKRDVRVNYVRNPSVEADATRLAGYQANIVGGFLTVDTATKFTPTRTAADAFHGSACAEWSVTIPTGSTGAMLYLGDPGDCLGTAMPVSNQDLSITSAAIKPVSALPAGAQIYNLIETYSNAGTRQYGKGYAITNPPAGAWQQMSVSGMEEFPSEASASNVPNTPPRWAFSAFWVTGLTAGQTYTFRTDSGLVRPDVLQTTPPDFNYFDGDDLNAEWLGTPELSASRAFDDGSFVSVARTTSWGVGVEVEVSRSTGWSVDAGLTEVQAARTSSWELRGEATAARSTTWGIGGSLEASRSTTWTLAGEATAARTTTWNTRSEATTTRTTSWALSSEVAASRSTSWALGGSAEAARSSTWNTAGTVAATRSSSWTVLTPTEATRTTLWATRAETTSARSSTWTLTGEVTAARSSTWTLFTPAEAARSTLWALRAEATSARATSWAVAGESTVARSTTWAVRSEATTARTSTWETRGSLEAPRTSPWTLAGETTSTRTTTWNTDGTTPTTVLEVLRSTSWTLTGETISARTTTWGVGLTFTAARTTTWAVLTEATAARSSTWSVAAEVSSARSSTWQTLAETSTARSATWHVLVAADAARAISWDVAGQAMAARTTSWDLAGQVTVARTTMWATLALVGPLTRFTVTTERVGSLTTTATRNGTLDADSTHAGSLEVTHG